jgi:CRP/FNR family transcriptional regulator
MGNTALQESFIVEKLKENYPMLEPALREEIARNSSIREFQAGDVLVKPGQFIKSTMLVTEGRVKVYKEGQEGGEFFMYYLDPGEACAVSMICAAKQEKSEILAKAIEDTEVVLLPIGLMDDLMGNYKTWYYFVLESYRRRFDELLSLMEHTVFYGLDERLDFYLKKQQLALNSSELRITHEEIASDLGTSRVVISRLLKQMELHGKVKLSRNAIVLVDQSL